MPKPHSAAPPCPGLARHHATREQKSVRPRRRKRSNGHEAGSKATSPRALNAPAGTKGEAGSRAGSADGDQCARGIPSYCHPAVPAYRSSPTPMTPMTPITRSAQCSSTQRAPAPSRHSCGSTVRNILPCGTFSLLSPFLEEPRHKTPRKELGAILAAAAATTVIIRLVLL